MKEIVEIIRRSRQGMTLPYICKAGDDNIYFVKGKGAGRRSLICEWIASNLAVRFGLPIASFEIVSVPEELIEADPVSYGDLGAGFAFASMERNSAELSYSNVEEVPLQLQQDLIVFDWWIRNGDRTLSPLGGNPNLLWEPSTKELIVIDHNQAFDFQLAKSVFYDSHVFARSTDSLSGDFMRRAEYNARLADTLSHLESIVASIPLSWWYLDHECTIRIDFDIFEVKSLLECYKTEIFWKRHE